MSKTGTRLLQGTLDLLILRTLSAGEMHGWGISKRIRQNSQDILEVNQGSLYPALYRLEDQGLIDSREGLSDSGRRIKLYSLTREGQAALGDETENWRLFARAVEGILNAGATA